MEFVQRIEAKTSLGITQSYSRLHAKPEVAEGIGKLAAAGTLHGVEPLALAYEQCAGMLDVGTEHQWYVLGEVLAVGIERNGIGKTCFQGVAETGTQCTALAAVALQRNHGDALDLRKDGTGIVGAAIIDHDDIETLSLRALNDVGYGALVVVGWYDNADAPAAHSGELCVVKGRWGRVIVG